MANAYAVVTIPIDPQSALSEPPPAGTVVYGTMQLSRSPTLKPTAGTVVCEHGEVYVIQHNLIPNGFGLTAEVKHWREDEWYKTQEAAWKASIDSEKGMVRDRLSKLSALRTTIGEQDNAQ